MDRFDLPDIRVALVAAPPLPELQSQWLELQAQAEGSFFTSWSWIGCWLRGLEPSAKVRLLRATRAGRVVGLGLLVNRRGWRAKVLPSRCLHLHTTGDPQQDEITVEHNGLLVHRSGDWQIERAMFTHLFRKTDGWDQLRLPGLAKNPSLTALLPKGMTLREYSHPSYIVDLHEVRRRKGDYLGTLSSNTRQQIRRSIKAYEQLGTLTMTEAPDRDTALSYLVSLRALHELRWAAKGVASVFTHPFFLAFHTRLISEGFLRGEVQLLRVQAGPHDIGYLYNFIHRGRVLFYQSGFDYELLQANSRPGMVTHQLAVLHNAALGHHTYDFMAGTARYKLSLASSQESMVWTVVHRKTLAFRLEEVLRHARQRWLEAQTGKPPGASRPAGAHDSGPSTASPTDMDVHPLHLEATSRSGAVSRL